MLPPEQLEDLSSSDPTARESAWAAFYPRARVIAASKLRRHYGLGHGLDNQDVDDAVDAAMGILYRRCLLAPEDNPVRQPYALLVSIGLHLLPKTWKRRRRDRELAERMSIGRAEYQESDGLDAAHHQPVDYLRGLAQWLLIQLDKRADAMPKEIKAGLIGNLFQAADLGELLEESLSQFPEARRRHCRLYHVEGLSTTEIAQRCGCGPSNISNNLRRTWVALNDCPIFRSGLVKIAAGRTAAPAPLSTAS